MKTTNKMKISKKEPKQKQNDISYYYFRKIITKSYKSFFFLFNNFVNINQNANFYIN